jgi:hypothetical protein
MDRKEHESWVEREAVLTFNFVGVTAECWMMVCDFDDCQRDLRKKHIIKIESSRLHDQSLRWL